MSASLLVLRRDLRLHDHPGFLTATAASSLTVLYVVDDRLFENGHQGIPRASHHRLQFLLESLENLSHALATRGQLLHVVEGNTASVVEEYLQTGYYTQCVTQQLPGTEEAEDTDSIASTCDRLGIHFQTHASACLLPEHRIQELFSVFPSVFSDFRRKAERYAQPEAPIPAPYTLPPPVLQAAPRTSGLEKLRAMLHQPRTPRFKGGETAGLERLEQYLWIEDRLATYKETRNGMLGDAYSSKLSPWLAWGCLSPRLVAAEIKKYERERIANDSTYWLYFELLWRDFFYFTARVQGNALFRPAGMRGKSVQPAKDRSMLEAWKKGETGIPLIDACMRELFSTGFMGNRGRQLVASFLVKDLRQPWLAGAAWFEYCLLDYDVASNYGNWQYVAGVGNDPREDRYFNILLQAERHDPEGNFVRHWIPALSTIPTSQLHKPHLWKHTPPDYVPPIFHAGYWERR